MKAFTTLTAIAAPVEMANIDTDRIIPVRFLRKLRSDKAGYDPYLFHDMRFDNEGREKADFVLNQAPYRKAGILVAGANFGCGSSREGAVWALMGMGVRAVIAPSFGDIFLANCFQNGLLPVRLPMAAIRRLAAHGGGNASVTVDLERQLVIAPDGEAIPFATDPRRREALLDGLDEIALIQRHAAAIEAFRAQSEAERPWQ